MELPLVLKKDPKNPNLHTIVYKGHGGSTPDVLRGLWSKKIGEKVIEDYKNRPMPTPLPYDKYAKKITNEEEAELFAEVEKETARRNKALEAKNNGKEESKKTKNKTGKQSVREGTDNGSKSVNVS